MNTKNALKIVPASKINTSDESKRFAFMNALKPIIMPLMFVGIQPKMSPRTVFSSRKGNAIRWWNILALLYLHVISVKGVVVIARTSWGKDFWIQITTLLRSGAATITADIYVLRQAKLWQLFRKISPPFAKFSEVERKAFGRRLKLGISVVLVFLSSYFIISAMALNDMGMENFLDVHMFAARIDFVSPTVQFVVGCIFMLIRQILMWGTVAFLIVLYITICDAIKMSFRSFNRSLIETLDCNTSVDVISLSRLRGQFEYFANITKLMDDVFSPIVFFWYSSFLLSVCIEITFDVTLYSTVDNYPLLMSILKLLVLFVAYALIGISASLAIEESQKGVSIFNRMSALRAPPTDLHVGQAFQMLGSHLESSRLVLTGWKFFNLNRTYMLTVVGIFASYVIIVVQLNPHFMTRIVTG